MRYCHFCDLYTLEDSCSVCKKKTVNPAPARFSPEDKYGDYRRKLKKREE